jgi:hypothetical protein
MKLESEFQAVSQGVDVRTRDLRHAKQLDDEAHATAIRQGNRDPGSPRQDKLNHEIENLKRHYDALLIALDQSAAEITALVDRNRDKWIAATQKKAVARREAYAAEVEKLIASRDEVMLNDSLLRWLVRFPNTKGKFAAGLPSTAMHSPSGESWNLFSLFEALRLDANGPSVDAAELRRFDEERRANGGIVPPELGPQPPNLTIGGRDLATGERIGVNRR